VKVVVCDLGIGNLHSLRKALEGCGAQALVTPEPDAWLDAEALVLPGVGAFGAGMKALEPVRDALRAKLTSGAPALGVCLGLQLLFERSDESPNSEGLKFVRGDVKRFPLVRALKVPHMGWSRVRHRDDPAFQGIPKDAYFYFVHSYYPDPEDDVGIAETQHGLSFTSVLRKGNTIGAQFHPEKSGPQGLRFLKNWLEHAETVV
jgi:imidazole glycerol-phosphate synthase subunit HisH